MYSVFVAQPNVSLERIGMAGYHKAASFFGDEPSALRELIDSDVGLHHPDTKGRTLLHCAAMHGHHAAVELLLDADVDVDRTDRGGRRPRHLACLHAGRPAHSNGNEHLAIVELLQARGAAVTALDRAGRVPLSYLPDENKRVGRMVGKVDGRSGLAVLQVAPPGSRLEAVVRAGSVSHAIHARGA